MTGSDLVVRCPESEGIRYAFGAPGEEFLDIASLAREHPKLTERLGHLVCPI